MSKNNGAVAERPADVEVVKKAYESVMDSITVNFPTIGKNGLPVELHEHTYTPAVRTGEVSADVTKFVAKHANSAALPRQSAQRDISEKVFNAFLGQQFVISGFGGDIVSGPLTHQTERAEKVQGKAPEGEFQDRAVQTVIVNHPQAGKVRITVRLLRNKNATTMLLEPGYKLSIQGDVIPENGGQRGRVALPTVDSVDDLSNLFG